MRNNLNGTKHSDSAAKHVVNRAEVFSSNLVLKYCLQKQITVVKITFAFNFVQLV